MPADVDTLYDLDVDPGTDWLSFAGACNLADALRKYWKRRGYDVEVRLEAVGRYEAHGKSRGYYGVRSNMVGGLPPGFKTGGKEMGWNG